jgi:hypothetical protein
VKKKRVQWLDEGSRFSQRDLIQAALVVHQEVVCDNAASIDSLSDLAVERKKSTDSDDSMPSLVTFCDDSFASLLSGSLNSSMPSLSSFAQDLSTECTAGEPSEAKEGDPSLTGSSPSECLGAPVFLEETVSSKRLTSKKGGILNHRDSRWLASEGKITSSKTILQFEDIRGREKTKTK